MGIIAKPNTFSSGTTIASSEVNANFDTIYNAFNGNIEAANLATGAITAAKLATDAVETAKIKDSNVTTAKIANSAVTVAKRSGGFKVGGFTLTGTGSKVITGVGFTPKLLRFTFRPTTSSSVGVSASGGTDGTTYFATAMAAAASAAMGSFTNRVLYVTNTSGTAITVATLTSLDSDGFTLDVTTYTGTYGGDWSYEAFA